jgi:hypothetical protein
MQRYKKIELYLQSGIIQSIKALLLFYCMKFCRIFAV